MAVVHHPGDNVAGPEATRTQRARDLVNVPPELAEGERRAVRVYDRDPVGLRTCDPVEAAGQIGSHTHAYGFSFEKIRLPAAAKYRPTP